MAGHAEYAPLLVGLGFDELSMSSHSILEVRKRIRTLNKESCAHFADNVLSLPDATSIEKALDEYNGKA